MIKRGGLWLIVFFVLAFSIFAAGELTQRADRLNYYDTSLNHTVTITNSGPEEANVNITLPSGWTLEAATNCFNLSATIINCNVSNTTSASYTVSDPNGADSEYEVSLNI